MNTYIICKTEFTESHKKMDKIHICLLVGLSEPRSFNYLHNDWSKPYIHTVNGDDQIIHGQQEHWGEHNDDMKKYREKDELENKNVAYRRKVYRENENVPNFGKNSEVLIDQGNGN